MTAKRPANWLLWGTFVLIVLAQTQCAVAKDLKDGPFVSAADLFAALLFGLWALSVVATKGWRNLALPPLPAWVFVAVAVLAAGRADSPEALKTAVIDVAQYVLYFLCLYALLLNILTDERRIRPVVWLLCVLTGLMALVALAQYVRVADVRAADETFRHVNSTFGVGETLSETAVGQKLHLAGKSSRSIYGSYLLMVLPVLFALGLASWRKPWLRVLLLVAVAVATVTLLSGWHFWALVAVLLVLALRHSLKATIATAAAAALFVGLSPVLLPCNHRANVVEVLDFYETGVLDEQAMVSGAGSPDALPTTTHVKKRWIECQPALVMVGSNPVLGVGTGGYQLHIGQYYGTLPNFEKIEPDTNCGWLVVAASMGLCGLAALAALLGSRLSAAGRLWATARNSFLYGLSEGLVGSLLGIFLANLFSTVLVRGLSITMVLLLALVSAVGRASVAVPDSPSETKEATEAS